MAETQSPPNDYTSGQPRKHHSLYLEEGTIVMQVENAIFKVHRSLVARYSIAMQNILNSSNECVPANGTEENPLVLAGDSAAAWEALLGLQYAPLDIKPQSLTGEQLLAILSIANKYHMERIEADIVLELKETTSYNGFIDLILASQIIGSKELYQDGIQRLISSETAPNVEQAKLMGGEATYTVMEAVMAIKMREAIDELEESRTKLIRTMQAKLDDVADNRKCRYCKQLTSWQCVHWPCRQVQV